MNNVCKVCDQAHNVGCDTCRECGVTFRNFSIEQHDKEIREEERMKVLEQMKGIMKC